MQRDLSAEVAALRAEVDSLARSIHPLLEERPDAQATVIPAGRDVERAARDGSLPPLPSVEALQTRMRERGVSGLLSRYGYYGSADRGYYWATGEQPAEELLDQDAAQVARVLAALGHRQRLLLLKAILQRPASVAELVERLGMGTTGQAYHHLRLLQAADLIEQEARGQFSFKGHRVPGFLTLLAGVWDMLAPQYSVGAWAVEEGGATDGSEAV